MSSAELYIIQNSLLPLVFKLKWGRLVHIPVVLCSGKHYLIRRKTISLRHPHILHISWDAVQASWESITWFSCSNSSSCSHESFDTYSKLVYILFIKNNYYIPSNMEELHPICPGCPNYYLYIKGTLLLINSLAQIDYIKLPRINMPKYKEWKSSSCLLKMPSCFPSGPQELPHLEQTTG